MRGEVVAERGSCGRMLGSKHRSNLVRLLRTWTDGNVLSGP